MPSTYWTLNIDFMPVLCKAWSYLAAPDRKYYPHFADGANGGAKEVGNWAVTQCANYDLKCKISSVNFKGHLTPSELMSGPEHRTLDLPSEEHSEM